MLNESSDNKVTENRILAIDFGKKRIGIAITDPLNMFAIPLITLLNDSTFWVKFEQIFNEYRIEKILLGYPLKESGEKTHSTDAVIKFSEELEKKKPIEVIMWDERYSSSIAYERIISSVTSKKKRRDKSLIDKNAAAVILEDYLNSLNN